MNSADIVFWCVYESVKWSCLGFNSGGTNLLFFLVTAQKHDISVNVWLWDAQAVKAWDPNDGDDLNVKPSEEFALNFMDKCENESFSLDWSMRGTWL